MKAGGECTNKCKSDPIPGVKCPKKCGVCCPKKSKYVSIFLQLFLFRFDFII